MPFDHGGIHPLLVSPSLGPACVLGVAGRDPRTGDSLVYGMRLCVLRTVFGAPPKEGAGSPMISTSKGTMPAWSRQRGGPLGVRQPRGTIRSMLEQFQAPALATGASLETGLEESRYL
jgi:hypothetical protein